MKRIIYIPFDHLHRNFGALKDADPKNDVIAFVESARMTTGRNWHKERLFFLISSVRHFAKLLQEEGFTVEYVNAATTIDGLETIKAKHKLNEVICAEPSSFRQFEALQKYGASFVPNDFFLTPRPLFSEWASSQKSYLMESFYRAQRLRLGILVEGNKPTGGAWNFDKENRLPPPKKYDGPKYLEHKRDEIDAQVASEIGHVMTTTWATTRKGALAQHLLTQNHIVRLKVRAKHHVRVEAGGGLVGRPVLLLSWHQGIGLASIHLCCCRGRVMATLLTASTLHGKRGLLWPEEAGERECGLKPPGL